MKYLLLLVVVIGAVWWLRQSGRVRAPTSTTRETTHADTPQDMVACTHCQVHIPRSDAIAGASGQYCCADHRQRHEG